MISDIIRDAETKMASAVEYAKEEFSAIRTGRAHPAMFAKLTADYYGAQTTRASGTWKVASCCSGVGAP